jgi:ribosomal protein L11 methyltransferase
MSSEKVWTEFSLSVHPEAAEAVSDLLRDLTGSGVSIEPPVQALGPDEGYVLDESAPLRLIAYFEGSISASGRAAMKRTLQDRGLFESVVGRVKWRSVKEEDWAETWKQHYEIERVGRIVIRPAWRDYQPEEDDVVISLDPGMAFGTGQHPTTRMCLAGLQELAGDEATSRGQQATRAERQALGKVLDLGSGSGILAIAAVALGAERVIAVDSDELAVEASQSNARLNGMEKRITVRQGSIEAAGRDGPFDVIVANLNAAAVSSLAGAVASKLTTGGRLFAGGIIAEREQQVAEALVASGLHVERMTSEGDWRTFVCRLKTG